MENEGPFPGAGGKSPKARSAPANCKHVKFYEKNDVHLYDLPKDLGEESNGGEHARRLDHKLSAYLASVDAKVPTPNIDYDPKPDLGIVVGPLVNPARQQNWERSQALPTKQIEICPQSLL